MGYAFRSFGSVIDTEEMPFRLFTKKNDKLRRILAEWPPSCKTATERVICVLTGFLIHVSFVIRPGNFFLRRMLAASGVKSWVNRRVGSLVDSGGRSKANSRVIVFSPEFHADQILAQFVVS